MWPQTFKYYYNWWQFANTVILANILNNIKTQKDLHHMYFITPYVFHLTLYFTYRLVWNESELIPIWFGKIMLKYLINIKEK